MHSRNAIERQPRCSGEAVALHSRELNTDVCVYCRWSAARGAEERGGGGRVRKLSARLWTGVVTVPVVNLYSIKRHLTRVQNTSDHKP